jgi:hypothetical protein
MLKLDNFIITEWVGDKSNLADLYLVGDKTHRTYHHLPPNCHQYVRCQASLEHRSPLVDHGSREVLIGWVAPSQNTFVC